MRLQSTTAHRSMCLWFPIFSGFHSRRCVGRHLDGPHWSAPPGTNRVPATAPLADQRRTTCILVSSLPKGRSA